MNRLASWVVSGALIGLGVVLFWRHLTIVQLMIVLVCLLVAMAAWLKLAMRWISKGRYARMSAQRVFVAYAGDDRTVADEVIDRLREVDLIPIAYDPSDLWPEIGMHVIEGIRSCRALLLVDPQSTATQIEKSDEGGRSEKVVYDRSPYVSAEIKLARLYELPIIVIRSAADLPAVRHHLTGAVSFPSDFHPMVNAGQAVLLIRNELPASAHPTPSAMKRLRRRIAIDERERWRANAIWWNGCALVFDALVGVVLVGLFRLASWVWTP